MRLIAIGLLFAAISARADQVVSLVTNPFPAATAIQYVSTQKWEEEGYIRVRALVDNPEAETCVSPTTSNAGDNIFFEKKLDVVITARVVGFANTDSSRDLPIAVYSWDGARYCKSAFQPPVLLVRYTPLRRVDDPNALVKGEPGIVLAVKTSSESKERISTYAQAALAISGELATGGAASTVASLTPYMASQTAKYFSDLLNSKSSTDQTKPIRLTWAQLAGGVPEVTVQLKRTSPARKSTFTWETIKDAVDRLQKKDEGVPVLNIKFAFDIRRSVLFPDAQLDKQTGLPLAGEIQPENVLNFPKKNLADQVSSLTINQLLNVASPSPAAQATTDANRASGCGRLLTDLRDAFAYHVDVPVLFDASILSVQPKWNQQRDFYTTCLTPQLRQSIEAYRGSTYFGGTPVLAQPELATDVGAEWKPIYSIYLEEFRAALYSSDRRLEKFGALLPASMVLPYWPNTLPVPDPAPTSAAQYFASLSAEKVGCMYGYQDAANNFYLAMALVAKATDKKSRPYLLAMRPKRGATSTSVGSEIDWVGLIDLEQAANSGYAATLVQAKFGPGSICHNDNERRTKEGLLNVLKVVSAGEGK